MASIQNVSSFFTLMFLLKCTYLMYSNVNNICSSKLINYKSVSRGSQTDSDKNKHIKFQSAY